jgi:CMP-N-acetylneuraminic acid synthetase
MKALGIIPARGGSKGIPRKNLLDLAGKPLIAHAIEAALAVPELGRVLVSTEDPEIAATARRWGADVPFMRPADLAGDETPTLPVLQHAVRFVEREEDYHPGIIVLLYATSPLLRPEWISQAIGMLCKENLDSVTSAVADYGHFWIPRGNDFERVYPLVIANRQYSTPLYRENGALYVCTRSLLMEQGKILGGRTGIFPMGKYESIDIDDEDDLDLVRHLISRRHDADRNPG